MSPKRLTISAFFMALVIILSSSLLSIPVPGGHFYFNGYYFPSWFNFPTYRSSYYCRSRFLYWRFSFYPFHVGNSSDHNLQVLAIALIVEWPLRKIE